MTTSDTRHYWHIVIQKKAGRLTLRHLGGTDGPDLTEYNVANCPSETSSSGVLSLFPPRRVSGVKCARITSYSETEARGT